MVLDQSSSVMLRKPPTRGWAPPTLLIRMSIVPRASATAARSAGPEAVERSTTTDSADPDASEGAQFL